MCHERKEGAQAVTCKEVTEKKKGGITIEKKGGE
jgi:hypothetical protein